MKSFLISIAVLVLAGCTTVAPAPAPLADKETESMLTAAIARVDAASASTRGADRAVTPARTTGASMTINYAGDAKDLLKMVAASRDMKFNVRGAQPHLPLFVIVNVKDVAFEEFLTDVGSQFGQRADLALTNNSIEVRYRGQ